ncbi:hypothetical protein [Algoriphagus terrigena]|uniref:hypothetical protein n=1 Tax=Algoriphagus terrigena TaxID=344884 RepID=UPI0003F85EE8|nr:hypothetical protein [Algoriphagus terrigena]
MPAKDSDNKQWSDPKDYGLPFVEITPLRPKALTEEVSSADESMPPVPTAEAIIPVLPVVSELEIQPAQPVEESASIAGQPTKAPAASKQGEEEKSSSWVWAVVLIGLGIVAVIVWQIMANQNTQASKPVFEIVDEPATEIPAVTADFPTETTATDQNQPVVNQDSITPSNISNPNISKPAETGTTIANTASGNLIRIESKTERPQYFIIVGSLPNEKLALEEATQYYGKSAELYLIAPHDGGRNYRLALSKFGSFKLASEKLEEIKSQYKEELWILKY